MGGKCTCIKNYRDYCINNENFVFKKRNRSLTLESPVKVDNYNVKKSKGSQNDSKFWEHLWYTITSRYMSRISKTDSFELNRKRLSDNSKKLKTQDT